MAHEVTFTYSEADQIALVDGRAIQRVLAGLSLVPGGYCLVATLAFGDEGWRWFWAPVAWASTAALLAWWYRAMIRKAVRAGREQNPLFVAPLTWRLGPEGLRFEGGASRGFLPWSRFVGAERQGAYLALKTGPETKLSAPWRAFADPGQALADVRGWIASPEVATPEEPPADALIVDTDLHEADYVQLRAMDPPWEPRPARWAVEGVVAVGVFAVALALRSPPFAYVVAVVALGVAAYRWWMWGREARASAQIRAAPGAYPVGPHRFGFGTRGIHVSPPGGGWTFLDWAGTNGWRETADQFVVTHGGLLLPIPKRGLDPAAIRALLEQHTPRAPAPMGPARPPRSGMPDPFEAPEA